MTPVPTPDDRHARLRALTAQAEAVILSRQDPRSGLLPASTAITVHGDYTHAWVRDNVYSIMAVWALSRAWQASDPARAAALAGRVTALMRGLLGAMMRQAAKVERFKHTLDPHDALHAKYATATGEPVVGDADWGHLQLDATALFLLELAQMSAAGLHLVRDEAELAFVQNLVHYLSKAWRTPDYGIWERGHKRNEGVAEINGSSLGMALAALEAIDGRTLLPGSPVRVLVMADDLAHVRDVLHALLPRESLSKETDAALLSVVGWPAFAVADARLAARTRGEIVSKLAGRHGCKRFLRDGHQTAPEDHSRLHYEPGELSRFEGIESEWPLFFTYLLLDAVHRGDAAEADAWRARLESLMVEREGQRLLPELYRVAAEHVEAERAAPQSQPREPNENVPLVWAQSLWLVGVLMHEGLLAPGALSPLRPLASRRGPVEADAAEDDTPEPVVHLLPVAADDVVQARLAARGLRSHTPAQLALAGVTLLEASRLQALLTGLGAHAGLGLGGRPDERVGILTSSRVWLIEGRPAVCLPALQDHSGFHLRADPRLLVAQLEAELAWLRRHWRGPGEPVLALRVDEAVLQAPAGAGLADWLAARVGTWDGAPEGADGGAALPEPLPGWALATLAGLATVQPPLPLTLRLSDAPAVPAPADAGRCAALLDWEEAATRPLTAERAAEIDREGGDPERCGPLLARLHASRNPYEQLALLAALWPHLDPDAPTLLGGSLRECARSLAAQARADRRWGLLRRAAGLLDAHDDRLEEAVTRLLARHKRVAVGRAYHDDAVLTRPLGQQAILERLRAYGGADPHARVLIEEIVLLLDGLMRADASLFGGTLTLRPWSLVLLLTAWLAREHGLTQAQAFEHLLELSPHGLWLRLREVLAHEREMTETLHRVQHLVMADRPATLAPLDYGPEGDPPVPDGGWLAWREMAGAVTRAPQGFHARCWRLLHHCAGLVIGDQLDVRNHLDSDLVRADTTPAEISFALRVDDLLNKISSPEYRQLTLEAVRVLCDFCEANPQVQVGGPFVVDVIVGNAVRLGWEDEVPAERRGAYAEHRARAWQGFYALPPHRTARLLARSVQVLVGAAPTQVGTH